MKIRKKTIRELERLLASVFPEGYELAKDNDGQLVVYTNLKVTDNEGTLSKLEDPEDEQPALFI